MFGLGSGSFFSRYMAFVKQDKEGNTVMDVCITKNNPDYKKNNQPTNDSNIRY